MRSILLHILPPALSLNLDIGLRPFQKLFAAGGQQVLILQERHDAGRQDEGVPAEFHC
ncbi:hypothetical protein KL86PLE_90630 [uncultured Pleomorphomonas sp.]|uniref:Uncharacterized protein n=1 Tax=uncultured Pleomorphomonas sp. TaxID=442121 RepID=A0A212LQP6_9HYPH|nr:hypothetical protein KL86PLE_90630 [uncultured Pleomorphomonas sp.]